MSACFIDVADLRLRSAWENHLPVTNKDYSDAALVLVGHGSALNADNAQLRVDLKADSLRYAQLPGTGADLVPTSPPRDLRLRRWFLAFGLLFAD